MSIGPKVSWKSTSLTDAQLIVAIFTINRRHTQLMQACRRCYKTGGYGIKIFEQQLLN